MYAIDKHGGDLGSWPGPCLIFLNHRPMLENFTRTKHLSVHMVWIA